MRVLWLVNVPMPDACALFGLASGNTGGWLSGQLDCLRDSGAQMQMQIIVCYVTALTKEPQRGVRGGVTYLLLPMAEQTALTRAFMALLEEETPDVIHIFGTEYAHSAAMLEAARGARCVVSLQGVMTEYAKHYQDGLPAGKFTRVPWTKALMKRLYYAESIAQGEREFFDAARREQAALQFARDVIGRTAWDQACAQQLCPQATYHKVNENLRAEFYCGDLWRYENCEPHSIFVSQALYPIKGFHQLVKALPALAREFPDVRVYVGGPPPYSLGNALLDGIVDYFFEYQRYIKQLAKQLGVSKYIQYTGRLDAAAMRARYLASNVFVSPSAIENSPNSVGEAMLLGVPVVSSRVGGVASMLRDGEDGLLYDFADTGALAAQVAALFRDTSTAARYGANAHAHAAQTHDRAANTEALLAVYRAVADKGEQA